MADRQTKSVGSRDRRAGAPAKVVHSPNHGRLEIATKGKRGPLPQKFGNSRNASRTADYIEEALRNFCSTDDAYCELIDLLHMRLHKKDIEKVEKVQEILPQVVSAFSFFEGAQVKEAKRAVLAAVSEKEGVAHVAKIAGVCESTVYRWKRIYEEIGDEPNDEEIVAEELNVCTAVFPFNTLA